MLHGLKVIQELTSPNITHMQSVFRVDARLMIGEMHIHNISHTHREGNQCADWLTTWVQDCGSDVIMVKGFPSHLSRLAKLDAMGIFESLIFGP